METKVIAELAKYFSILDAVAILAVYFLTQQFKGVAPKIWRPFVAIALGFIVAIAFAAWLGGWEMVPFFGIIYGASAIALRKLGFSTIINKVSGAIQKKIGRYGDGVP